MTDPVIVIGAGMGGLAAAMSLAGAGLPVEVVEAGPRPGGKAGIAVPEGVEVDTGPSVLTMPHVFRGLFARTGRHFEDVVTLTRPTPACRYRFADGLEVDMHSDHAQSVASVTAALGADAGRQLDAFLRYSRTIWENAAPHFVEGAAPTPGHILALGPAAWAALPRIDAFRSMSAGIGRFVRNRRLRWILERYATYNGSDPRQAPATLNCIAHVELGLGVYGVEGGIHALVRAMEAAAIGAGATFRYGTRVAHIHTHRGRVVAVETDDGTLHRAQAVVANADAIHVLRDLLAPTVHHGLDDDPPRSMSGWVGVVRARPRDDRAGHTVLFPHTYEEEFADIFDRDRPPADPTVYVCAQGRAHRRAGWDDGREPLFVMANAPSERADRFTPDAVWSGLREVVMGRLRRASLIDDDDDVVWTRSPGGLAREFPGTRGAIYGASSNDLFAAFKRPPNRVARVPGLYLASGSAHPGGGLPLCALSGRAAAEALLADGAVRVPPAR